jgi:hypothetical protein
MTRQHRYDDAFDEDGILKDGRTVRVSMRMRDQMRARDADKSQDAKPAFTDGHNLVDPAAGLRPGYRMPVVQGRSHVHDAYAKADCRARNQYKVRDGATQCPDCDGEGYIDGAECETCYGSGVVSDAKAKTFCSGNEGRRNEDSRSVTRDQAYRDYDQALSSAWQNGRTG